MCPGKRGRLVTLAHRFPNWGTRTPRGTQSGSGGTRGENVCDNGKQNAQNCNFQTETSLCASKSPKFPCVLSCKAVFLSYKHNNDCNDEQALIRKQNH